MIRKPLALCYTSSIINGGEHGRLGGKWTLVAWVLAQHPKICEHTALAVSHALQTSPFSWSSSFEVADQIYLHVQHYTALVIPPW